MRCDLGDLVDLSASGLRVNRKGKPPFKLGQCVQVRLTAGGQALRITAQAMWMKRNGLRHYSIGMRFLSLSTTARKALDSVAQFGFFRRGGEGADTWAPRAEPLTQQSQTPPAVTVVVDLPDYYGVLGVDPSATIEELRSAYRTLVRKYHPDVTTDAEGPLRFQEVQEAYEMLRDPECRESYDARKAG